MKLLTLLQTLNETHEGDPMRPWYGRGMGEPIGKDGYPTPEQIRDIRSIRKEVRDEEGVTSGMCHFVSEIIHNKYGWTQWSGVYTDPNGDIICSAHLFNILPNGALLDATADQFGEGHDIRVIQPDEPEYLQYRMEWMDDYNPSQSNHYPELKGVEWSGEMDDDAQNRINQERGLGWWISNSEKRDEYLNRREVNETKTSSVPVLGSGVEQNVQFWVNPQPQETYQLSESTFPNQGFWITPEGSILEVDHQGGVHHPDILMDHLPWQHLLDDDDDISDVDIYNVISDELHEYAMSEGWVKIGAIWLHQGTLSIECWKPNPMTMKILFRYLKQMDASVDDYSVGYAIYKNEYVTSYKDVLRLLRRD